MDSWAKGLKSRSARFHSLSHVTFFIPSVSLFDKNYKLITRDYVRGYGLNSQILSLITCFLFHFYFIVFQSLVSGFYLLWHRESIFIFFISLLNVTILWFVEKRNEGHIQRNVYFMKTYDYYYFKSIIYLSFLFYYNLWLVCSKN